ncbi:DNA topoisomerase [Macrococcus psychrotolerans]
MYNNVIIAEKPSQAREYANALGIKEKKNGYILLKDSILENSVVTWGIGHLVRLKYPDEYENKTNNWDIANLPYCPDPLQYTVDSDKRKQFNIVKDLIKNANTIINGCDIDREGSNIFYSILRLAGHRDNNIKRLWINSLVEEEIIKGFKNLKDNQDDILMYQEANARQISDYLIGMNLSPLYTNLFKSNGLNNEVFSIGRVQTPTLYMIYNRYLEINNFKEETFYEISGDFEAQNGIYKGKAKIKTTDKNEVESLMKTHDLFNASTGTVTSVDIKEKSQKSPKLHSLSTLQSKINKTYKYSPEKTKKIVQQLYEKKILSYPRTDSNLITDQEFNYLKNNLNKYMEVYNKNFDIKTMDSQKRYVNSEQVKEHHAIIPTSKLPTVDSIKSLSIEEKYVLNEVVNTTFSMFAGDYIYEETKIITNVNDLEFYSTGKVEKIKGWKVLFNENDSKDELPKLPKVNVDENVKSNVGIITGKTKPPNRYTEGQLINLMKSCGKYVENDEEADILKEIQGLGTEATRDSIIESLKKREYIKISKNKVDITDKGIILCEAIAGTLLSSPEMTAKWEQRLKQIGLGQADPNSFSVSTMKFINNEIEDYKNKNDKLKNNKYITTINENKELGDCINCNKGKVIEAGKVYKCTSCNQVFFKKYFNNNIPKKELINLITKGRTENKIKLKKKDGKSTYTAYLKLKDDKEKGIKIYSVDF